MKSSKNSTKFNQVQRTMDEMLARYKRGERFPTANGARKIAMSEAFGQSSSVVAQRLHQYAIVDLPLMEVDKRRLKKLIKGVSASTQTPESVEVPRANVPNPTTPSQGKPKKPKKHKRRAPHMGHSKSGFSDRWNGW